MDALELLHTRQSAGKLQDPPPDDMELAEIFRSAVTAPDHGRLRPWRFVVIRDEARERFGEVMAKTLKERRPDTSPEMLERERAKPMRAPLIVVVAAHTQAGKIPEIEQVLAVGAAAQNIMLAAHALGFGAMWRTGDVAYDASVKTALGLEPADSIVGLIYLGTPAGDPPPAQRPVPEHFVTEWTG
ncbi:MAG TPA: nitroreductase [Burkholderiales bacterium]|jgi:nitroreductase|nr:nitroreductase [Burkholderiales bacterium]